MERAIVIGAGIIGGSIAWRLSQDGWQVTLFDAGTAGGEASWAGAGMLAPGGEVVDGGPWADFALESLRAYPAFVDELQAETGHGIDLQRNGAIEVATTFDEWSELAVRAEKQKRAGIQSQPLDEPARDKLAPLATLGVGALYYPDDAVVCPRDVVRCLIAACRARGVELREGEAVRSIEIRGAATEVVTAGGRFTAEAAVLAAGAWSSSIPVTVDGMPCDVPASYPVRGHLLGYRLAPGLLRPILRHHHTYLLQRSSGFLVAGTTSEEAGFDRNPDPEAAAGIARRATKLLPCLAGLGHPEVWIGFRPGAAHPVIGRAPGAPNLWLSYGHYRNGILLAPANARRLAAAVTASAETGLPSLPGSR